MIISSTLQKGVVDRGGFGYASRVNRLTVANRVQTITEACRIPSMLANRNGLTQDCPPVPALTTNAKEARCD